MSDAVAELVPESDVNIFVAAVADLRPLERQTSKWKRAEIPSGVSLDLVPNPDVAGASLGARKAGSVSVGFALESERLEEYAAAKLADGRFDLVVANPAGEPGAGFGSTTNRVTFFAPGRPPHRLPLMEKERVADELLDQVERIMQEEVG